MTIVVVSPHRDDAAFSLGLAVEAWLAQGHPVTVLNCFTQSAYAPYSDAEALHPNDRTSFVTALRRREDVAWSKLLTGRFTLQDLDLMDAPLRLGCAVDEVLSAEIRPGDRALARVQGAIAKLAKKAQTQPMALVAPLAIGGHIDHRIVHEAVLRATAEVPMPVAFYEDLPYATRQDEAEQIPDRVAAIAGAENLEPEFAGVGVSDEAGLEGRRQRKFRMAECYDSQVDSDVVRAMADFCSRYEGRERVWAGARWRQAMGCGQ